MPAYILGTIEITDPAPLDEYGPKVAAIVERFGGRIRSIAPVTVLEGDANPTMAAVIEFDDAAAARRWYDSPDYTAIRGLRQAAGRTSVLLVDDGGNNDPSQRPHGDLA